MSGGYAVAVAVVGAVDEDRKPRGQFRHLATEPAYRTLWAE
jgi:hypothetical protein